MLTTRILEKKILWLLLFFRKKTPKNLFFFWGPNSNACPSSSLAVDKAWFLFWTWSYAASWGGEGLPPPTVRRNRWVKTNSQTIFLIVLLKKKSFPHNESCGWVFPSKKLWFFFSFRRAIGLQLQEIMPHRLYLCHQKKKIPEKRFSGSKVSKFSLTNPSSSSLSDQEAVALRLAPAGRRKGVLCKMSYADS